LAVARDLPAGRHRAGDRHLKFHDYRDNLTLAPHHISKNLNNKSGGFFDGEVVAWIGRITPAGVITEFSRGISQAFDGHGPGLRGITAGPDGNLWFTEGSIKRIGRITPEGVVTEFPVAPAPCHSGCPELIIAGPDGNLWFTEELEAVIGRITPEGVVTEFKAGTGGCENGIAAGADDSVWFTDCAYRLGRITPEGKVTRFPAGRAHAPVNIAAACDGNLWFAERSKDGASPGRMARITPKGKVTEFPGGITAAPMAITAGPDGNVWLTEINDRIGRIGTGPLKRSGGHHGSPLPAACPRRHRKG
jgi:virginiamycin B lyase